MLVDIKSAQIFKSNLNKVLKKPLMGLFLDLVLLAIRSGQGSCESATVKADFASFALGTCRRPRFELLKVSAASDHVAVGDEVGLFHVSSFLFLSDKSIIAWNGH